MGTLSGAVIQSVSLSPPFSFEVLKGKICSLRNKLFSLESTLFCKGFSVYGSKRKIVIKNIELEDLRKIAVSGERFCL